MEFGGSITESSKKLYEGNIKRLNNGSIPPFLKQTQ